MSTKLESSITPGTAPSAHCAEATGYPVWVFKEMYGPMVKVLLQVGDTVKWKRNGTAGCYGATVVKIGKVPRLRLESHEGRPIPPREVNAWRGYHRAYRNGVEIAFMDNVEDEPRRSMARLVRKHEA